MDGIKNFIIEAIQNLQPYIDFCDETKLLQEDILDSVSVLVLVQDLEEKYEFTIEAEEIKKDNFETINSLAHFVYSKVVQKNK